LSGITLAKENTMGRLACALFMTIALALGAVGMAAGSFDGRWTAHVVRPAPATPQDLTITLTTGEGGKVAGSVAIQGGAESPIDWGFVKGDLIVFKVKMPFNDQVLPFVYIGTVQGTSIAFGRRPEDLSVGRLVEFTANRSQ
jgi:hypothetical protein